MKDGGWVKYLNGGRKRVRKCERGVGKALSL
jgi:hypothetical protein